MWRSKAQERSYRMKERRTGVPVVKIVYAVTAAVLFLAVIHIARAAAGRKPLEYRIVCMGDSILAQARDNTGVTALLEEKLGIEVFNGAFGGTCMGKTERNGSGANSKDSFSMAALAQSVGYGDFGPQQASFIKDNGTEYFPETVDALERIDFSKTDILIIEHGTNDYNGRVPLYNEEDPYDVYTFTGALRTAIETLQKRYPGLRIILVSPTYCWFMALEQTCEEWYSGSGYLEDYVEAEAHIAVEYGIEQIDLYHGFYPHEAWEDWRLYTTDGLHPNEAGRQLIADRLAEYLLDNPLGPGGV